VNTSLRTRLIVAFLAATLVPLALTLWITTNLLEFSLGLAHTRELDELSLSLERTGREYYQQAREALRADVEAGRVKPEILTPAAQDGWLPAVRQFFDSGQPDRFLLLGEHGDRLAWLVRRPDGVAMYARSLGGVRLGSISEQYAHARTLVREAASRDLRGGFNRLLMAAAAAVWLLALAVLVYSTHRIAKPIRELTAALSSVAGGNLATRVVTNRHDEVAAAIEAFNHMAEQLQQSRERLLFLTRLASWQALARKMAHEVKNSLTPIRLTMEEIAARSAESADGAFLEQAAQIVVDEVNTLERRVRAFSELAAEPPVRPEPLDINALADERVAFLRAAHPEVIYQLRLATSRPMAFADPDLVKGILTNLLENAAQAAGPGGVVLVRTTPAGGGRDGLVSAEVHDSGPGLSLHARGTLFEPTISFKKAGMGLGLSIARKSALLSGGDILLIDGELGGAAFRVVLAAAAPQPISSSEAAPAGAAETVTSSPSSHEPAAQAHPDRR
jgi:two-component system, NtrC family, nitrogen regulation sensor histidine kinase NtrY